MSPPADLSRISLGSPLPHLEPRSRRLAARALIALYGPLVRVENRERAAVSPDPTLFVFNHNNSFESVGIPALLVALRRGRLVHMLIDWMFLELPVIGWVMRQVEPIPVFSKPARWRWREGFRQSQLHRSAIDEAVALLAAGRSVGLFPEGTRHPDPRQLGRVRPGLARIVSRSEAPVVPVGIEFPAAAGADRVPHVGRMVMRIGEPVDLDRERAAGAAGMPWPELRSAMETRVMGALGPLCGKAWRPTETAPGACGAMEVCHDVS